MRTGFGSRKVLLAVCAAGVALRLVFLLLTSDLDLFRDEGHYVYLALIWNRFGFYPDGFRYLWPPGFSYFLSWLLDAFGERALFAAKLVQVLGSASIGLSCMALAQRLFGGRAAIVAGVLWAVHLPLIGFTHTLWNETFFLALFLPCIVLLASALEDAPERRDLRIAGSAALFAATLYVKDAPIYLAPLLAGLLLLARGDAARIEGLRRALLFAAIVVVLVAPWTLRNFEVYGRLVPMGSSLAENVFRGINATYRNFDIAPFSITYYGHDEPIAQSRQWFIENDGAEDWTRVEGIANTPDRLAATTRRGLAYAVERPGWLIRTRIKKLADLVAPYSFVVRHAGIGMYDDTPLGGDVARRCLLVWAILGPVVVLVCAVPGLALSLRRRRPADGLLVLVIAYFGATALLVSMSRFRIPMMPFLIVMAAGFLAGRQRSEDAGRIPWPAAALGLAVLGFLWWINVPETMSMIALVWRGGA